MAAKKKAAGPVDVPEVLLEDDGNKLVAKTKATLAKKWNVTRVDSLEGAVKLAWFLVALHREKEARELAELVGERVVFGGDIALWAPAASCIALAARLARLQNDEARRASLVARVVAHPAVAGLDRDALVKWIAVAGKDVRSAEVDPSQKYALEGFARGCARATYVRETASEGGYPDGVVSIEALETTIDDGLQGLRAFAR